MLTVAKQFAEEALAIKRELKDKRGQADALGNLGLIYLSSSEYEKAVNASVKRGFARRYSRLTSLHFAVGNALGVLREGGGGEEKKTITEDSEGS